MQAVEDPPIETIHLYVVREKEKRPPMLLPLFGAFLCLAAIVGVTVYSAYHPYYEHETLRIPAQFLPLRNFYASAPIIPTGVKTYPSRSAQGLLTLTNGSVLSEILPRGIIFTGKEGAEVVTQASVFIPPGSASGYGVATVPAQAVISGTQGNIPAFSINAVYGTSLYIRNLEAFTGGKNAYSVKVVTPQDRQTALDHARTVLTQSAQSKAILAYPCKEVVSHTLQPLTLQVQWACQYITYTVPSYMKVTHIKLVGKLLFVDVVFVPRPRIIQFK